MLPEQQARAEEHGCRASSIHRGPHGAMTVNSSPPVAPGSEKVPRVWQRQPWIFQGKEPYLAEFFTVNWRLSVSVVFPQKCCKGLRGAFITNLLQMPSQWSHQRGESQGLGFACSAAKTSLSDSRISSRSLGNWPPGKRGLRTLGLGLGKTLDSGLGVFTNKPINCDVHSLSLVVLKGRVSYLRNIPELPNLPWAQVKAFHYSFISIDPSVNERCFFHVLINDFYLSSWELPFG